jgi:hypothetical protein
MMSSSYVSLAGRSGTAPFAISALCLALSGSNAICVDHLDTPGQLGWKVAASSPTIQTRKFSTGTVREFVPRTAMGKSLQELRQRILQGGGARPAAVLLAEIREHRGEA